MATIEAARAAEREGGWITYLARDPRRDDLKLAQSHDSVRKRIKAILHSGHVPIFEVLDRQPTRLLSLVSETNFARACRRRGYDIANLRRLQNVAGPPGERRDIPADWLWDFSLEEATADDIRVRIGCKSCGEALSLEASQFQQLEEPPKDLRAIEKNSVWLDDPCTFCGARGGRSVSLELA